MNMVEINLLPWREEEVKYKTRKFMSIAIGFSVSCFVITYLIGGYISKMITSENLAIKAVRQEIKAIENLMDNAKNLQERKRELLLRREIIEGLQSQRVFVVEVFSGIAKAVPKGVVLKSIRRMGDKLTINGLSESNTRVATLIKDLKKASWVLDASLGEIKSEGEVLVNSSGEEMQQIEFILKVNLDDRKR